MVDVDGVGSDTVDTRLLVDLDNFVEITVLDALQGVTVEPMDLLLEFNHARIFDCPSDVLFGFVLFVFMLKLHGPISKYFKTKAIT